MATQQNRSSHSSHHPGFIHAVVSTFKASTSDIIFGMEDGTVSIFGLVAGVAFSASSGKEVLLAGAAGAAAASISMMAGDYLQSSSKQQERHVDIAHERSEVKNRPKQESHELEEDMKKAGFDAQDIHAILQGARARPSTMLKLQEIFELHTGDRDTVNPLAHATWMFISDAFAAFSPVIPFALFPLAQARVASMVIAALLLFFMGMGRGIVGHRNVWITALETLGIGVAASIGGILIGKLIHGGL